MNNPEWQRLLQLGKTAVQQQRGAEALTLLQQATRLVPESRETRYWLGNAQRLCGRDQEAEQTFGALLAENPSDLEPVFSLAFMLRGLGRVDQLESLLLDSAEQNTQNINGLLRIAGFLRDSDRFPAAISVMRHVLKVEPRVAAHYFKLARLYQGTGDHESAVTAYRDALSLDPAIGGAWLGLSQLQQFSDPENADWQRILSAPADQLGEETAMCLAFARGKGFDDLGQYPKAWDNFMEGNRLRQKNLPWDSLSWEGFVQKAISIPVRNTSQQIGRRHPVYIVGMLRSGTTLLEQLLDQHPQITARGELNFLSHAWASRQEAAGQPASDRELGDLLWNHLRLDGPESGRYIDKNPLNFRFIPLLSQVLPEARVIHITRDGRDSCLSCFMQLFQHPDTAFSNQLESLVSYYQGYLALMRSFSLKFSRMILTISYEELVSETEATLQKVTDFLDLEMMQEWQRGKGTPAAGQNNSAQRPIRTASTWQARQAVHGRSMGRWKNYHAMAPEFFDQIAELDQQARIR